MTIKSCVVLNGQIINVGEWDYQFNEQEEAQNPLPEGTTIEDREFEYSKDYGWREVGYVPEPTEIEKLTQENQLLKAQNNALAERADFIEDLIGMSTLNQTILLRANFL